MSSCIQVSINSYEIFEITGVITLQVEVGYNAFKFSALEKLNYFAYNKSTILLYQGWDGKMAYETSTMLSYSDYKITYGTGTTLQSGPITTINSRLYIQVQYESLNSMPTTITPPVNYGSLYFFNFFLILYYVVRK